jgi:hypothetical protein
VDPVRACILAHAGSGVDSVAVKAVEGLMRADDGSSRVTMADSHLERDCLQCHSDGNGVITVLVFVGIVIDGAVRKLRSTHSKCE